MATSGVPDLLRPALQLLAGENDEHRFAGLLIAARLLPSVADARLLEIYDAVGCEFFLRLLLPVRNPRFIATIQKPDVLREQLAVAEDPELHQLIPALCKLVRCGSLVTACAITHLPPEQPQDQTAVQDALEVLTHVCAYSTVACCVALDCAALAAVSEWICAHAASTAPAAVADAVHCIAFLSSAALGRRAAAEGAGDDVVDAEAQVVQSVAALAFLVGFRRAAPVADAQATRPNGSAAEGGAHPAPEGPAESVPGGASSDGDWRSVQLLALASLAAGLTAAVDHETVAAALRSHAKASAPDRAPSTAPLWPAHLSAGLQVVLASRLPQRHIAAALACVDALTKLLGQGALLRAAQHSSEPPSAAPAPPAPASTPFLATLLPALQVQTYAALHAALPRRTDEGRPDPPSSRADAESGAQLSAGDELASADDVGDVAATCLSLLDAVMELLVMAEGRDSPDLDLEDARAAADGWGVSASELCAFSDESVARALDTLSACAEYMLDFLSSVADAARESGAAASAPVDDAKLAGGLEGRASAPGAAAGGGDAHGIAFLVCRVLGRYAALGAAGPDVRSRLCALVPSVCSFLCAAASEGAASAPRASGSPKAEEMRRDARDRGGPAEKDAALLAVLSLVPALYFFAVAEDGAGDAASRQEWRECVGHYDVFMALVRALDQSVGRAAPQDASDPDDLTASILPMLCQLLKSCLDDAPPAHVEALRSLGLPTAELQRLGLEL